MQHLRTPAPIMKATMRQGKAWVPEYSGNDSTWRVYRSALVTVKRKVNRVGSA
jgi:hypothetical protein